MNLLFNYFEGSNEGIVGREVEMRGSIAKCWERPLEEGGCEIPVKLPMNDGAMESVEYMSRLDYVTTLQKCVSIGISCSTSGSTK